MKLQSIRNVIKHEGGYVNHPKDPGGETKFGITKRSYPNMDIARITEEDAIIIYNRDYWARIKGDELPEDVANFVLDSAVNMGVSRAVKFLQTACGVNADGIIGPATIKAAHNTVGVLEKMADIRRNFYKSLSTFPTFGKGWMRRVDMVLAESRAMGAK